MQFTTSVTQKGQATIPASIRKSLGIKPNTKIVFELRENNEVILKPVTDFFALKGSVKSDKPFDLNAMEKAIEDEIIKSMLKNLLDTNLIIRFLVNDDIQKVNRVEKLLKNKNNTNILLDTVVAEIIWVLSSYYSLEKTEVIEKMRALIHVDTIDCNAVLLNKALTFWEGHNISYVDSYIVAVANLGNLTLFSYDDKLKSIGSITVKEP